MAREMKDSGLKWVGNIPKEWKLLPLKSILSCFGRIGFRGYTQEDLVDKGEGPITLSPTNIVNNMLSTDKCSYISWEKYYESPEIMVFRGDIIFVKTASVGKCAIYDSDEEATINPQFVVFKEIKCDKKYLFYSLISPVIQFPITLSNFGSVIGTITQRQLLSYKICTPTVNEQIRIASHLDSECSRIDSVIEQTRASIEEYKKLKQAVITEAVTKGIRSGRKMKDSGIEWIGNIPVEWELIPIKRLASCNDDVLTEDTDPDFAFDYIEIGSVEFGKGIIKTEHLKFADAPSRARRIVKENDIIVSTVRTYLKAIAPITYSAVPLIVSTGFAVIRSERINSSFLRYSILSNPIISMIEAYSVGISYPAINSSQVIQFKIPVPNMEEQLQISEYLEHKCKEIDQFVSIKEKLLSELETFKKSLIFEYVTGKKEVPV